MNKVYNTQEDFASKIKDFLKKVFPNIRLTQLKIIPYIIIGMLFSESTVASDIAKNLKDDFSLVQHESVIKRIKRLFTNKFFNGYTFYDKIIKYVISTYKKKHSDKRIHIIFDHCFSHNNYTIFMMSFRIGKIGIPLWFRCFEGKNDSNAFLEDLFKEGILYISNLFDNSYDLIFLADRWFISTSLMDFIDSLGHTFCIRVKGNIKVYLDNYEKPIPIKNIKPRKHSSKMYNNIYITDNKYKTNLVVGKSKEVKETWYIVTNGDVTRTIKDYGYRFGGVETIFKNTKSNGFNIECTCNTSLKYFESMYSLTCFGVLFMTIIGADYSKNTSCYRNVNLTTHKKIYGIKKRIMSLFNIGLTLFILAHNSKVYIRIPFSFTLYDI